ncbi:uncharacterized protein [Onthophagus taurus]|uniref:uncharacterized protein n=1 Tax=Onthophagus taurus TaxID=166361 RepID=UPI000C1FF7C2|nr:uncharacterized protein LOC111425965 [Onthophagus taurus]
MKEIGWLVYLTIVICVCQGNDDNYKHYYLEDPNLCSAAELKQGKIKLDESKYTAAQLLNKRPKHNFHCTIKVKTTTKGNGIIAVIQELGLRRNESSGQCIDYVTFISENGVVSRKYCGMLNAKWKMDPMFVNEESSVEPVDENTFLNDINAYLIVDIFISELDISRELTPTTINIVFTLYKKCQYRMFGQYEPCLDDGDVCIKPWYFNDRIINCPYAGCVDEGGCRIQSTYNDKLSIGSKVIISSMSSLVISFVVFVICIYLCRKYKKLCWSEDWSQPQQSSEAQTPRVIEMNEQPSQSQEQTDDRNVVKDLPPSYESLFPDR